MLTLVDEKKGLVKTDWESVRIRVSKVAPEFAKLVDSLSPNKTFSLYLAYYPYGDFKGDTVSTFLPKIDGSNYRITDPCAPKDVINNLGYGSTSSPFGMLLEKKLEYFIDLKDLGITIPWKIYSPGAFFPLHRVLQSNSDRVYTPNGLLTAVSGTRSAFMLPKIGCLTNHLMLQRSFNVQSHPPKSLYEHWNIFKGIINSDISNCNWRSCVMYFSKKWVDKINNDKAWYPLKKFLLEMAQGSFEYARNHIYYNIAYSLIQSQRNLKPNPYLTDTACHLFTIALGAVPGYSPACNNDYLPLDTLQSAFVEAYGMKKYIPTIMQPTHFYFENKSSLPVYYSLQCPTTLTFSPKSRKLSSTLFEMRELKHIVTVFNSELVKDSNILSGTVLSEVSKKIDFSYFHNKVDRHNHIQPSSHLITKDNRFNAEYAYSSADDAIFAEDAPFVRGCIRLGLKE
jgi:hypothetical protein